MSYILHDKEVNSTEREQKGHVGITQIKYFVQKQATIVKMLYFYF